MTLHGGEGVAASAAPAVNRTRLQERKKRRGKNSQERNRKNCEIVCMKV